MVTCLFNVHGKRLVWPTTAKEVAFDGNVVYDDDDYLIVDRILVLLLLLSQSYTRFSPPPLSSSSGQCSNKLLLFFYYSFGWIYIVNSTHASIFNGQFKIAPKCKPISFRFLWQLHNHIISRLSLLTYQHILNLHKLPRKYFSNHYDVNVARCTKLLLSYSLYHSGWLSIWVKKTQFTVGLKGWIWVLSFIFHVHGTLHVVAVILIQNAENIQEHKSDDDNMHDYDAWWWSDQKRNGDDECIYKQLKCIFNSLMVS